MKYSRIFIFIWYQIENWELVSLSHEATISRAHWDITNPIFYKKLVSGPSPKSCWYFHYFHGLKLLNCCSVNFKSIPVTFQRSSLTYCIPLVKDQSSFYEVCIVVCMNIKAFNSVNRKQLSILKTFLEYLKNYIVANWRWFSTKSCLTNCVPSSSCS